MEARKPATKIVSGSWLCKDILTLESVAFQHSVRASLSVGQIPTRARQCKGLVEGSRGAKAGL